jgi:hypothetical protein
MAGKVNRDTWEEMGAGLIAKIPFQENVNYTLINLYRFFDNDSRARGRTTKNVLRKLIGEDEEKLKLYNIITELIPLVDFEQKILPDAYENSEDGKISDCCDEIVSVTMEYLNDKKELKSIQKDRSEYIKHIIREFLEEILSECEKHSFKKFVKGLENSSEDIDSYTIELISNRFKRDIYFLNSEDRIPYNNSSTMETLSGRKSIILLWVNGNHYEIVGRLLPGNRIQREFSHNDPLIQKMYNFLVNPELVPQKYPELKPYLAKDIRTNFDDDSDNDSETSLPDSDNDSETSLPDSDNDSETSLPDSDNDSETSLTLWRKIWKKIWMITR